MSGTWSDMPAIIDNELSEADVERISDLVYRHCGINLHDGKKDLMRARIFKRLRAVGTNNASEYIKMMEADGSGKEFRHLIDAISTNLTSFFREIEHFNFLREKLLPDLVRRKKSALPRVR